MNAPLPRSRGIVFAAITGLALASDLVSKWYVFGALGYSMPGEPPHMSDWEFSSRFLWGRVSFRFLTSFNEGALFGVGQGFSWLFALLSVVASGFIFYWLFFRGEARSWWLTVTLGLIMAGTLGNLFDRMGWHGCQWPDGTPRYAVRDFLDCTFPIIKWDAGKFVLDPEWSWPIFNLADVFLVTGAIMLTVHSFRAPARTGSKVPVVAQSKAPAGLPSSGMPTPA